MVPCQSRRGGVLFAAVFIIATVALVAIGAVMLAGLFLAGSFRVVEHAPGGRGVETPFGSLRVRAAGAFDPRLAGLPLYPGATRVVRHGGHGRGFALDFGGEHHKFHFMVAEFETRDPIHQVGEYYRRQFPEWSAERKSHRIMEFHCHNGRGSRIVAVRREHGRTRIVLASAGEPAAN